jgi:hypothetical protein
MSQTPATARLRLVPQHEVGQRWPEFRGILDRAIQHARGELDVDDILSGVLTGHMGMLAQEEGGTLQLLFAFEIIYYPRQAVFNIIAMAGRNFAGFAQCWDLIDVLATEVGASVVRCFCRPAVARRAKQIFPDAQVAYVVMEREVRHAGVH